MFKVDFVGVVCLANGSDVEQALLPDGRDFDPPHAARIVVQPQDILSGEETWGERTDAEIERGEFRLPKGTIAIEKANEAGTLDAASVNRHLPSLSAIASGFVVDRQSPNVWSSVDIRQGTLQAFRWPGTQSAPTASVLTQLTVAHDGGYRVTVTDRNDPNRQSFLDLAPGTNVVIVNDSPSDDREKPHFHIYNRLAANPSAQVGTQPPATPPEIPALVSTHPFYNRPINGEDLCPNTRP